MVKSLRTLNADKSQCLFLKQFYWVVVLGCEIGTALATQAVYACSKNLIYKIRLAFQDIMK